MYYLRSTFILLKARLLNEKFNRKCDKLTIIKPLS